MYIVVTSFLYFLCYSFNTLQVWATKRHGGTNRRTRGYIRGVSHQTIVAIRPGVCRRLDGIRGRQRHHTRVEFQV